jgi:predicted transposase/invertase (TIGR01784 family)
LEYLSKIYAWQKIGNEDLKIVIPFVFYHGEKGWDLGQNFLDSFKYNSIPEEFLKFIPNFSIQLLELKSGGDTFQTKNLALRLYMRMIQIIRDKPEIFSKHIKEIYLSILEEKEEAKRIYILKNLLDYLFRARNDADKYTKKEIIKEIEGDYMNLLEKIRKEGKLEGELEGEIKGKLEKALETARKMKVKGFSVSEIQDITGLSDDQLKENGIL